MSLQHSFRAAFDLFHGPSGWAMQRLADAARVVRCRQPYSARDCLDTIQRYSHIRVCDPPLALATQNVALFPTAMVQLPGNTGIVPLYRGTQRGKVMARLETWLRSERPDAVVFTEFWMKAEKSAFAQQMRDLYPFSVAGPDEQSPRAVELEPFDGGILVLSRHPIAESHQTVYRQCSGEDCFVNKGVVHLRIQPPGLPDGIDVFGSHMQSCPPEYGEGVIGAGPGNCREKLEVYQTQHLRDFVQAFSDPTRPAFLLGDLNQNGITPEAHQNLWDRLERPLDLWLEAGDGTSGITSDRKGSFRADDAPRNVDDAERGKLGTRLDYVLAWPGSAVPGTIDVLAASTTVLRLQTSPGRDLSDHYGVTATIAAIGTLAAARQTVASVRLYLRGLRCLRETGGPIPLASEIAGSDEIVASVSFRRASDGQRETFERKLGGMDSGTWKSFADPLCIDAWPDPGPYLEITGHLVEEDPSPVGPTGTVDLGTRTLQVNRAELLRYKGQGQIPRTLRLFNGDGGEYALTVAIEVT